MSEEKTTAPPAKQTTAQKKAAATAVAPPTQATDEQLRAAIAPTKADAARAVVRRFPGLGKDGQPTVDIETVPVTEDEVLDFAVRGNIVTVVTVDGQRLRGTL